jgi:CBS domain-containing protein
MLSGHPAGAQAPGAVGPASPVPPSLPVLELSSAPPSPPSSSSSSSSSSSALSFDVETALQGRRALADFMRAARAYEIIPESNKVIVFDTAVPVRLAFYALVEHGETERRGGGGEGRGGRRQGAPLLVPYPAHPSQWLSHTFPSPPPLSLPDAPCALLWDSEKCRFAGLMTTSDIVDIMRIFYTPGTGAPASAALSELTIAGWRAYAGSTEGLKRGLSSPDFARLAARGVGGGGGDGDDSEDERDAAAGGRKRAGGGGGKEDGDGDDGMGSGAGAAPGSLASASTPGSALAPASASASAPAASSTPASASARRDEERRRRKRRAGRRFHRRLISVDPEDSLLSVSQKLRHHRIHHMPVLDVEQSAVVAVISHRNLLQHVLSRFTDTRSIFSQPVYALGIGSFDDVVVVPETASVISVLNVLADRRISAVPVVNAAGQVIDVYSRDDVAFLANDPTLMVLDAPVGEVRRAQVQMVRREGGRGRHRCPLGTTNILTPPPPPLSLPLSDGPDGPARHLPPARDPPPCLGALLRHERTLRAPHLRRRALPLHGHCLPLGRLCLPVLRRAHCPAAAGVLGCWGGGGIGQGMAAGRRVGARDGRGLPRRWPTHGPVRREGKDAVCAEDGGRVVVIVNKNLCKSHGPSGRKDPGVNF